ncbi:DNA polymerase beta superfamily protein [Nocardia sp. NPDC056611]|uniref:nucleotidyltransferase domain-containing protein n=1 Tax=Nocardia sp. NPDC056611 TaxID=3345877 RepID=UPI00366D39F2
MLLEGVVGSTAYGLNTPLSDIDYAGIYVEPTASFLGLHPPSREHATETSTTFTVDCTYHEVGKALSQMLKCNPTNMELLWLEKYTHTTPFGEELISLRSDFLAAQRVRDAFFGYATQQFGRLVDKGRFQGSLETRREKHARHTMRLLWQGYELYTTGHLPIRVPDPEPFFEFGRRVKADPAATAARELIAEYEAKFDEARTVLPDAPNETRIEDLLQRIRRAYLDGTMYLLEATEDASPYERFFSGVYTTPGNAKAGAEQESGCELEWYRPEHLASEGWLAAHSQFKDAMYQVDYTVRPVTLNQLV